jgi:hypothetical protein
MGTGANAPLDGTAWTGGLHKKEGETISWGGIRSAADIWKPLPINEDLPFSAAYQKMIGKKGLDRCGVTVLAGKAVGAPFVRAIAAALAISEILRLLHEVPLYQLIDLDIASLEHRTLISSHSKFFRPESWLCKCNGDFMEKVSSLLSVF